MKNILVFPEPQEMEVREGKVELGADWRIVLVEEAEALEMEAAEQVRERCGMDLSVVRGRAYLQPQTLRELSYMRAFLMMFSERLRTLRDEIERGERAALPPLEVEELGRRVAQEVEAGTGIRIEVREEERA